VAGSLTAPRRLRRRPDASTAIVVASVVAFLVVAALHVTLPGLYYDEVFQETTSLAFVKGGLGSQVAWVPGTEVTVLGHPLPLMAHSYIGAVKTISFAPVAALAGLTPDSVRFFTIGVSALALLATAAFARQLFSRPAVAAVATALLATDPSYVFFSRVDFGPSVFMFLLKAVGLWQLALWWRTDRTRFLLVGSFAFGLGVYDKLNFFWIVAAVGVAALLLARRCVLARFDRHRLALAAGAFLLGCLPVVGYNLSWPPRSIEPALRGSLHIYGGNQSGGPWTQLVERFRQLVGLLDGRTIGDLIAGTDRHAPLLPILAAVAASAIVALSLAPALRQRLRPALFVVVCGLFVLIASALTPGGSYPHHVLLAYPFPHLAVAALGVELYALARERLGGSRAWLVGGAITSVLAAAVAVGLSTSADIVSRLEATGGRGNFSDAIYGLNRYLERTAPEQPFVALDWGIYQPLIGLSEGGLKGRELWLQLNGTDEPGKYRNALTQPTTSYVLHVPSETNFPRARERFFSIVRANDRRARLIRVIDSRQDRGVFEIYRVS
jgi:Dolichyl-phosphate-mannose-protein mannosyltransferase